MIEAASRTRGPQQLEVAQIDQRFSSWRLASPREQRRLEASEGRIRDPLMVSTAVEARYWVLVDGFKRLRVAEALGFTHAVYQRWPARARYLS